MTRYFFVILIMALIGVAIVVKAGVTMFAERQYWQDVADRFVKENVTVKPNRGNIISSDGKLMASSLPEYRIYMDFMSGEKDEKRRKKDQARRDSILKANMDSICIGLHKIFPDKSAAQFKAHLQKGRQAKSRNYLIYPKRISYIQYKEVKRLPVFCLNRYKGGFKELAYNQRKKPFGSLAARTLGDVYADTAQGAKNGIELAFDTILKGRDGLTHRQKVMNKYLNIVDVAPIDGCDLITTIDVGMQDICEKALVDKLKELNATVGVVVLMEVTTGEVKAISGGRGAKTANLTLNRATNVPRQPGSTFKVISSFAPALDTCGATLGSVYYDAPYTVGTKTFRNWYSGGYQGYSSIRDGIIYSMNIVAVRCMMETVTPQLGVEYAKNFGITTLTSSDYNAATALGGLTEGVTNLELTSAFATIANQGMYTEPIFFTKIIDRNGKVLINNEPETRRVLKDSTAFLLTDALKDSMIGNRKFARPGAGPGSTSTRAKLENMSCAGKSGTTTGNNDIWFVGFTPYYTAGIWSGYDLNQKLSSHTEGTSYHKDIWRKIMTRVHEGMSDPGFTVPDSVETASICRKSGKLAIPGVCDHDPRGNAIYTEYFAKGTVPTESCNVHTTVTVCAESGMLPTEFCPEKISRVCITLPAGETGETDDSYFAIPGYCPIHGSTSTVLPSESDATSPTVPYGPGYITVPDAPPTVPTVPENIGPGFSD